MSLNTSLSKIQVAVVEFALNKQKNFWEEQTFKIQQLLKNLADKGIDDLKIEFSVDRDEVHQQFNYKSYEDVDSFYWSACEDYSVYFKDIDDETKVIAEQLLAIIKSIDGEPSMGFGNVSVTPDDIEMDLSFSFNGENHKD